MLATPSIQMLDSPVNVALCGEWRGGDSGWSRSLQETLLIVKYCGDKINDYCNDDVFLVSRLLEGISRGEQKTAQLLFASLIDYREGQKYPVARKKLDLTSIALNLQ